MAPKGTPKKTARASVLPEPWAVPVAVPEYDCALVVNFPRPTAHTRHTRTWYQRYCGARRGHLRVATYVRGVHLPPKRVGGGMLTVLVVLGVC